MVSLKRVLAGCLLLGFWATTALASVNDDMKNWFNSIQDGVSNYTPPGLVQGQTRNVLTGGSIYARTPVRSYSLADISAPSFKAGCGGIDLFAGSFSFINKDNFVKLLRNIGNNAMGYAFEMALCTISPDICDYLKYLQDQIAKMNSLNINSCKAAEGIVNAAVSSVSENKEGALSRSLGTLWGDYTDAFESYNEWKDNADTRQKLRNKAKGQGEAIKNMVDPGNVVWNAMNYINGLSIDNYVKEMMMSLIGTVVIVPSADNSGNNSGDNKAYNKYIDGTDITLERLVGTISSDNTGTRQVDDSKIKLLKCGDYIECKDVSSQDVTVTPFVKYIDTTINKMSDNIRNRINQNQSDYALLGVSALPVWKLIEISAELPSGNAILNNYEYFIALDVAKGYIMSLLDVVSAFISHKKQDDGADVEAALASLSEKIQQKRTQIQAEYNELTKHSVDINRMTEYLVLLQKEMNVVLPTNIYGSMKAFPTTSSF
jgi:conjugative transfer pilus assembly protein TraH